MGLRPLVACVALIAACLPGRAEELTIVVNRSDTAATLYIAVPASELGPVFGADAAALLSSTDLVIDAALQDSLFDQAGMLLAATTIRTRPNGPRFQGMSMVLHPIDDAVAFGTPWDASLASSVCTVPPDSRPWRQEDLLVYAGFAAHGIDGTAGFTVEFPATGREPVDVVLRDFIGGRPHDVVALSLADGGALHVAPVAGSAFPWWAVAGLAMAVAAAWVLFGRRRAMPVSDPRTLR